MEKLCKDIYLSTISGTNETQITMLDELTSNYELNDKSRIEKLIEDISYFIEVHNKTTGLIDITKEKLENLLQNKVIKENIKENQLYKIFITYCIRGEYVKIKTIIKCSPFDFKLLANRTDYNQLSPLSYLIRMGSEEGVKILHEDSVKQKYTLDLYYDKCRPLYECLLFRRFNIMEYIILKMKMKRTKEVEIILENGGETNECVEFCEMLFLKQKLETELTTKNVEDEIVKV